MGMRGTYHRERVEELVKSFPIWRESRFQGARAFQSMYDRVGVMVCKWLFQSMHDIQASSGFDYILPLMVGLFRNKENEIFTQLSFLARTIPIQRRLVIDLVLMNIR